MTTDNRREFSRVSVQLAVTVSAGGRQVVSQHTRDLSLNGLFVPAKSQLPEGTECRVTIHLGDREHGPHITAAGRVARVTKQGFAVAFTHLELESVDHLRKVIRYGAEDPDTVEEEFDGHIGLKPAPRD